MSNDLSSPTVAVMQWRNEIDAKTTGMKVLLWHGAARKSDPRQMEKYDIVLSTYAVVESSYRKQESSTKRNNTTDSIPKPSPLHSIEWARVVVRLLIVE